MRAVIIYGLFFLLITILLFNCHSEKSNPFLNAQKNKADYVGMETCRSCHASIYETYMQTGMGQSWGLATKQKSAADYSQHKALVYDSIKDFYYKPYWVGDSLWIMEFRLRKKHSNPQLSLETSSNDTLYKRFEKVSYIVGSGQHTNSHIIDINGYLHQAPITFYTQKGQWDLAPGFEKGMNTRFERKIEMECITCHNGFPNLVEGSLNKYNQIKLGIDCERCHGPGSLHVADKQSGNIIDTAKFTDYTIVNPRKISTEQQNNLCQRCHLQGIAVLNDNKSFKDFKPSEKLSTMENVFMPTYDGNQQQMIMASHVERMKMSNCYLNSGKMSCITCHNPHISVKFTPEQQYISACKNCHQSYDDCKETRLVRDKQNDNCIACHMPKNSSIDIPHVAVTDHYIRREIKQDEKNKISKFLGMKCYNDDHPDSRATARSFLEFFERYEPNKLFLDSAIKYLKLAGVDPLMDPDHDLIRTYFLLDNYQKIVQLSQQMEPQKLTDAWTCYRIGESFIKLNRIERAVDFFRQAVLLKPFSLDFQNKLGMALIDQHQWSEARKVFTWILSENPKYAEAYGNLGFLAMQEKDWKTAKIQLMKSLMLNPDHVQTLINLSVVCHEDGMITFIKPLLFHALELEPDNTQVKAMLSDIN